MPAWDECKVCGGPLVEAEGEEFQYARCERCGTLHAFDDDDGWFALPEDDDTTKQQT